MSTDNPIPASAGQLHLPLGQSESSLKKQLEDRLGRSVVLVLTDNSTTMLSARVNGGVLRVRLHRIFLNADQQVLDEIAVFLKNRKGGMPNFRSFIRDNREQLAKKPPQKISLNPRGRIHDLREMYSEINEHYFNGEVNAAITWGSGSPRSTVRKRTLGSYSGRTNTIRINPVLDRKPVPRYFVSFIVYHEMLHAALGTPLKGKRRSIHSPEFKKREKLFKEYEKATAWERGKP